MQMCFRLVTYSSFKKHDDAVKKKRKGGFLLQLVIDPVQAYLRKFKE